MQRSTRPQRNVPLSEVHLTPAGSLPLSAILSVVFAVACLLGLTVAMALCTKGSSSYDPIPVSPGNKLVQLVPVIHIEIEIVVMV